MGKLNKCGKYCKFADFSFYHFTDFLWIQLPADQRSARNQLIVLPPIPILHSPPPFRNIFGGFQCELFCHSFRVCVCLSWWLKKWLSRSWKMATITQVLTKQVWKIQFYVDFMVLVRFPLKVIPLNLTSTNFHAWRLKTCQIQIIFWWQQVENVVYYHEINDLCIY